MLKIGSKFFTDDINQYTQTKMVLPKRKNEIELIRKKIVILVEASVLTPKKKDL